MLLLDYFVETKVKKQCPFLKDFSLKNLKDNTKCAEDAYSLSLVFERAVSEFRKGDKKAVVSDMSLILSQIPEVLDTCGQNQWADLFREYLPMDCVHSVTNLLSYLVIVEHNYEHFEWLIKNYKGIQVELSLVRMNCPFLKH